MNKKVTQDDLDYFLSNGHFIVQLPDGSTEDYDVAIPDFLAQQMGHGECVDSNGSEIESAEIYKKDDTKIELNLGPDTRVYLNKESGEEFEWPPTVNIKCIGKVLDKGNGEKWFILESATSDDFDLD